jgi:hypothetical protein
MSPDSITNYNLDRLDKIRYEPPEVFTPGRNALGEQLLVGMLDYDLLVAIFFSPEGNYLRYQFHPVLRVPDPSLRETIGWQRAMIIQEARECFVRELKMIPSNIRIRHFAFPDWDIGIAE